MSGTVLPVSVVIASRDRPALLADTVTSILGGSHLPAEIVVVDQSDRPHADLPHLQTPAGCALRYEFTPVRGLSRANNLGVALAAHDHIVFTHDDVLVDPEWLRAIVDALTSAQEPGVVTGRVLPAVDPSAVDGFAPSTITTTVGRVYRGRIRDDVVYPMNLAALRATIDAVGGFDDRLGPGTPFPAAEDNDLGHRLLEAGFQITYEPGATVHHRAWRRRSEQSGLHRSYGRGQGAFYAKHLQIRDRYMLRRVGDDLRRNIVRVPRSLAGRGQGSRTRELAYLWGLLEGMTGWSVGRRRRAAGG